MSNGHYTAEPVKSGHSFCNIDQGIPGTEGRKIFIVEDELVFAEDLKETLERRGYRVCGNVSSAEEALRTIPETAPDLILVDIVLAGTMNGIELADALNAVTDIPVIYLTSNIEEDTIANAKCTHPYGYIPKPFDERVLFSTIEIALFKHQADKQIRESENRYRTFVENIQGIAYRYDHNNTLEFFHGAVEKISGYSASEFTNGDRTWFDIIHPDDRICASFSGSDDLPPQKSKSREYRIIRKDGDIRWIHDQIRRVNPSPHSNSLYEGIIYDITSLKTIEADLRKACDIRTIVLLTSGHYFRRFLKKKESKTGPGNQRDLGSSLSEILGGVGYEMGIPLVLLNKRTSDDSGVPIISENLRCVHPDLLPPVDFRYISNFPYTRNGFWGWDEQLRKGYPVFGQIEQLFSPEQSSGQIYLNDQSVTSVIAVPIFCDDQFWGFIQGVCYNDARDWTEYEISSLQITADVIATILECGEIDGRVATPHGASSGTVAFDSQPPATLMDAAVDIVFIADANGKILHLNRAGQIFFEMDRGTERRTGFDALSVCIKERITRLALSSSATLSESPMELELPVRGERVYLDLTLAPVTSAPQSRQLFIGIARDVTRQKKLQNRQRQIQKKLQLMQRSFRHDLTNQITAILGYLSLLRKGTTDPSFLDFIQKEERIVESIKKSMSFTKTYEHLGDESAIWIDIHELFTSAWASLSQDRVRLDLFSGPLEILADPLFRNVIFNLLDNSLRHGGDKLSFIRVSLITNGDEATLCYEDDGIGILEENKEKIFNRGFYTNNGFGLLLSREILSLTGLIIRETGSPGKGARFEISVPTGMWRIKSDARENFAS